LFVAPEALKYPPTLEELEPVEVTIEERPVLVTPDELLAPEIAMLRPVLPAAAAVEVEESDKMLPEVRPLAAMLCAVDVVTEFAAIEWAVPVPV